MNQTIGRDLFAHGLIIAAACIGGWMMLVQPKAQSLAELESAIDATRASDVPLTQQGIEALAGRLEQARRRVQDIQAGNAFATDSSQLYASVMDLADKHEVVIERLRPGSSTRKLPETNGRATRVDLTASGSYEKITLFLDDIVRLHGFMRPVSLSLQASGELDQHVSARLVCEAMSFELPEQLTAAEGAVHVEH